MCICISFILWARNKTRNSPCSFGILGLRLTHICLNFAAAASAPARATSRSRSKRSEGTEFSTAATIAKFCGDFGYELVEVPTDGWCGYVACSKVLRMDPLEVVKKLANEGKRDKILEFHRKKSGADLPKRYWLENAELEDILLQESSENLTL